MRYIAETSKNILIWSNLCFPITHSILHMFSFTFSLCYTSDQCFPRLLFLLYRFSIIPSAYLFWYTFFSVFPSASPFPYISLHSFPQGAGWHSWVRRLIVCAPGSNPCQTLLLGGRGSVLPLTISGAMWHKLLRHLMESFLVFFPSHPLLAILQQTFFLSPQFWVITSLLHNIKTSRH